jgi:hypothetical protein
MKNPVEYLNQRIQKQMFFLAEDLQRSPPIILSNFHLKTEYPLYEEKTFSKKKLTEEEIYENLAIVIAWSTNPFSIVNATCLERSINSYKQIIPLLENCKVKRLAEHHFSSTKYNLKGLESISRSNRLRRSGIGR